MKIKSESELQSATRKFIKRLRGKRPPRTLTLVNAGEDAADTIARVLGMNVPLPNKHEAEDLKEIYSLIRWGRLYPGEAPFRSIHPNEMDNVFGEEKEGQFEPGTVSEASYGTLLVHAADQLKTDDLRRLSTVHDTRMTEVIVKGYVIDVLADPRLWILSVDDGQFEPYPYEPPVPGQKSFYLRTRPGRAKDIQREMTRLGWDSSIGEVWDIEHWSDYDPDNLLGRWKRIRK